MDGDSCSYLLAGEVGQGSPWESSTRTGSPTWGDWDHDVPMSPHQPVRQSWASLGPLQFTGELEGHSQSERASLSCLRVAPSKEAASCHPARSTHGGQAGEVTVLPREPPPSSPSGGFGPLCSPFSTRAARRSTRRAARWAAGRTPGAATTVSGAEAGLSLGVWGPQRRPEGLLCWSVAVRELGSL